MGIEAGTVVVLKSGGQAMTVIKVDDDEATCIWMGEEGDFFREEIPLLALDAVMELADADEEDEDEEDDADEPAVAEADEEEDVAPKKAAHKRG
jgi:uncharacterized protein YodC (DUF2158 family)